MSEEEKSINKITVPVVAVGALVLFALNMFLDNEMTSLQTEIYQKIERSVNTLRSDFEQVKQNFKDLRKHTYDGDFRDNHYEVATAHFKESGDWPSYEDVNEKVNKIRRQRENYKLSADFIKHYEDYLNLKDGEKD